METRANYALVGAFTLIGVLLAGILLGLLTNFFKHSGSERLDIYVNGSATGLNAGSAVLFNGLSVGEVKKLVLDPDNPNGIIAQCVVHSKTPITQSTKAVLTSRGVTGIALLELTGGNKNEPRLLDVARQEHKIAVLHAYPASLDQMLMNASEVSDLIKDTVLDVHQMVKTLETPLTATLHNAQSVSSRLAQHEDFFDQSYKVLENLNNISQKLNKLIDGVGSLLQTGSKDSLIDKIQGTVHAVQSTAENLNRHVGPIIQNIEVISGRSVKDFEAIFHSLNRSVQRLEQVAHDLSKDPSRVIWGGRPKSTPSYDGNIH